MPEDETTTETETTSSSGDGSGDSGGTNTETSAFTQDDLTRVGTKEFKRGKTEAAKALAAELGMSVDDAKKVIGAVKEKEEAEATEADKARKEAADAKAQAEQAQAQLRQTQLRGALLEALTTGDGKDVHPVAPGYRDAALDLALVQASRSDTEDLNELAAEAVEHVRKTATVFFTASGGAGPANGTPGPPVKTGDQTGSTQTDAQTEAQRMLAAHKPKPLDLPAFGGKPKAEG